MQQQVREQRGSGVMTVRDARLQIVESVATNCLDKKIFGGPGIKKQCCKLCRCLTFLTPLQVLNYMLL